jgi:Na+/H+ antiporter NhaA
LHAFLQTESGSAGVLLLATVAALVWANLAAESYAVFWETPLAIHVGKVGLTLTLREWVNSGLMTFFFFVVGLEARREFDLGELRQRRRVALPLLAGLGGMIVPVVIFLALNAGRSSAAGWGMTMSTDTAFALGLLALVARGVPDRVRIFLLTVVVVDDLVALLVIATVYSGPVSFRPFLLALGFFGGMLLLRLARIRYGLLYFFLAALAWVALQASGVEPVVLGLAVGLLTSAYAPARADLERATDLFRLFREQPTPELAESARMGLAQSLSPNERLQRAYHPWTSYVIVPLFALANAGVVISSEFLAQAATSPVTLGVVLGYVLGKPIGIVGTAWLVSRLTRGRLRIPVGWAALAGTGAIAGIGFTVSLLIASLAFHGPELQEAKLGVIVAAMLASLLAWMVFGLTARLSPALRTRALLGTADTLIDLAVPVDEERDHIRGPADATVTLVEYGDFECPYCGQAEPVVRALLQNMGDLRYVWRHLPLTDVHPNAALSAEAAEAADRQGAFWPMHDLLLQHQQELRPFQLVRHAADLGLDEDRFREDLRRHVGAAKVADDVDSAGSSGVTGTPTFFVNGRRQYGAYDIDTLTAAIKTAKAQAKLNEPNRPRSGRHQVG